MAANRKDMLKYLRSIGIKNAIVDTQASVNNNPAILLRWNGQEEYFTGFSMYDDQPEYESWLIATFADQKAPGRPPLFDGPMRQVSLYLRQDQIAWLQAQPDGMAATIRGLVEQAMSD